MIRIEAGTSGFHFLSPVGALLAPDVFLNTALYPEGDIALRDAGNLWESADSRFWPTATIVLDGPLAFDPDDANAAPVATVRIGSIRFLRTEGDATVEAGRIALSVPLDLTAHRDPDGDGGAPLWLGAAADALAARIRAEGYRFEGGAGDDVFAPHQDILPIYGRVEILGRGGEDRLEGGRSDGLIRGGAGADTIRDSGGTDQIFGGPGDDSVTLSVWSVASRVRGGPGDDRLASSNGGDTLIGNAGDDWLSGGRGCDRLMGNAGADVIDGGEGDDRIVGGAGDDLLTGGEGADLFVFRAGQTGHDIVTDFDPLEDRLHIRNGAGFDDPFIRQDGSDTLVTWDDGLSSIRLTDVDTADLGGADSFLF